MWETLKNRVYDWDELLDEECCDGDDDMVIVLYGQRAGHDCKQVHLIAGELEKKWIRDDGLCSWQMRKHIIFQPDPHYDGYSPEYIICPPQGAGVYCPTGFESFTSFTYERLEEGLCILGYKNSGVERAKYAVRCVFGNGGSK